MSLLTFILALIGTVAAQTAPDQPQQRQAPQPSQQPKQEQQAEQVEQEPIDGLWPTPRMLESFIRRMTIDAAAKYRLTDQQQNELESVMLETWPPFLKKERPILQPLLNEFFEARLELEPPSKEKVQQWADKALPVFARIKTQFETVNEHIRPILTPEQRLDFESEITRQRLGLLAFEGQLTNWKNGQYEISEWWDQPSPAPAASAVAGSEAGHEVISKSQASQQPPPDQILLELGAWEQYVHDFAVNYGFDERQQATAESILTEVKNRALAHRSKHLQEIIDLEQKINAPEAKDDAEIYDELVRLYQPVDELFKNLQERLNSIPTRSQRQAAATQPVDAARQPTTGPAARPSLD